LAPHEGLDSNQWNPDIIFKGRDISIGEYSRIGKTHPEVVQVGTESIRSNTVFLPKLRVPIQLRKLQKPHKKVKTQIPRNKLLDSLQLADRMREMLDNGEAQSKADIARQLGLTRARVTQVMKLLELPASFREAVIEAGPTAAISERLIRSILTETNSRTKVRRLKEIACTHLVPT